MTVLEPALVAMATTPLNAQQIMLCSGRDEPLVAPPIAAFTAKTGICVNVRSGGTAEPAILLQEQSGRSPADVAWSQHATAPGSVVDVLAPLPDAVVGAVPAVRRDTRGRRVATSGRGRILARATDRTTDAEMPRSLIDLTDPRWKGRIVRAPTNAALHGHLTAARVVLGDDAVRAFLQGLMADEPIALRNKTAVVQAMLDDEGDIGLTNDPRVSRVPTRNPAAPVAQALFEDGGIGNLPLVAAAGVLKAAAHRAAAERFVEFLLSPKAEQSFVSEIEEVEGMPGSPVATGWKLTMEAVVQAAPDVDLTTLSDLEGTLEMPRDAGIL